MSESDNNTIPLKSRLNHKFYEPVVLVKALNHEMRGTAPYDDVDSIIDINNDKELYECVINKINHICDSIKGEFGRTTTSSVILKNSEGHPHYLFASNGRSIDELKLTKAHLIKVLRKLEELSGENIDSISAFDDLLSEIVSFNESRINYYLRQLHESASLCQQHELATSDRADQGVTSGLCLIVRAIDVVTSARQPSQFNLGCSNFIQKLEKFQSSRTGITIKSYAREGRMHIPSQACWSGLQHMISRLVAYSQSTRFLILARNKWPAMFQKFEVSFLESSKRMPAPFRNKSQTAESIVGRMTRKEKEIKIFRDFVRDLQMFNLDSFITAQYRHDSFRPIVHSEVLILDHLGKTGRLRPEFFFNNIMYIGTSKPTCKLCEYYFSEHKSRVGFRPGHGNIYLGWRFPDVLESEGPEGERKRQVMFDRVLQRVRKDAFDMVKKRLPSSYKEEDSHTYSAALPPSRGTSVCSSNDLRDAIAMFGDLHLNSGS